MHAAPLSGAFGAGKPAATPVLALLALRTADKPEFPAAATNETRAASLDAELVPEGETRFTSAFSSAAVEKFEFELN